LGKQKYIRRSQPRIRDKRKHYAQHRIEQLVDTGKIKKPKVCAYCKTKTPKHLLHGHHYRGYGFPLDVIWICHSCHAAEHAGYLNAVLAQRAAS
jgi:hypothetical protein